MRWQVDNDAACRMSIAFRHVAQIFNHKSVIGREKLQKNAKRKQENSTKSLTQIFDYHLCTHILIDSCLQNYLTNKEME